MTTVSYTDFRKNLAYYLDKAEEDCEQIVVTRDKGRRSIILSFDDFESLKETAYLLSTVNNRKHLEKSLRQVQEGKVVPARFEL